jgi:hypothetical protein
MLLMLDSGTRRPLTSTKCTLKRSEAASSDHRHSPSGLVAV